MNTATYCCLILLVSLAALAAGCEDRGTPRRSWVVQEHVIIDDVLYMAITREFGRHYRVNDANYLSIEKMDCYVLEYSWPLATGVSNAPIGGSRYLGCGGALSWHEARDFIATLGPFAREERQSVPGLPREVQRDIEQDFMAGVDGELVGSALVDGQELFLVRPRFSPSAIMTREGEVLYEFPEDGVDLDTIWNPRSGMLVSFSYGSENVAPGTLQRDFMITGLRGRVVVFDYLVGKRQEYHISEEKAAEYLLQLEKGN